MHSSAYNSDRTQTGGEAGPAAVDWVRRTGQVDAFLSTLDRHVQKRRRRRWAQAVGATMVLVVTGFVWTSVAPTKIGHGVGATAMVQGAGARQVLVDGSEVDLNAGADLAVAFSAETRRVALQRGMAHFRVAKSPVPFVVVAGGVEVRAVGTAFTTKLGEKGDVEVVVTEGTVAIDRPASSASKGTAVNTSGGPGRTEQTVALLKAGHRLVIPAGALSTELESRISTLSEAQISQHLDWRAPELRFDATPLAEAVLMFNRHSKIQLRLADEALGAVKLSGSLRGDNVVPLIRMLELEHGLKSEREGDVITISSAQAANR